MLTVLSELPDNVLEVSAEGNVTGADYETILIPALAKKLESNKKVRFLYHLGAGFKGFEPSAMLDDAKVGLKHLAAWEKIALVSDHEMINIFAKFFGHFLSCEVRVFKDSDLEKARNWIIE